MASVELFERFREATARLPAGLIRPGPPADPRAVAGAEAALGRPLPDAFTSFLRSFDGADLFHESVVIAGVGRRGGLLLLDLNQERPAAEPVFAEATGGGDRFAFDAAGRVLRLRGGAGRERPDERWLAGSDFTRWLDALVAHERLLYDADGEFRPDAFDPDGTEVTPLTALRQAERALRLDPGSAELQHERGIALRRLGRGADAEAAFLQAGQADPANPWPWFDLGRDALSRGPAGARAALDAFRAAAGAEPGAAGARFCAWAARAALLAALPEDVTAARAEALARAPELAAELARAVDAARADGDAEPLAEAGALLAALIDPVPAGRARLTVLMPSRAATDAPRGAPARRPPPPAPRRPRRGGRRPGAARPKGSRT